LNGNDGITLLDDTELEGARKSELDPVVYICLPSGSVSGSWRGKVEWIATTVQVNLTGSLGISG
jgi:hypothetical protein